jgi:hypothetical protein
VVGGTVTFTPSSVLPGNVRVRITGGSAQDFAGNAVNAVNASFVTAAGVDASAPELILSSIEDGATGVSRSQAIVLTFSESLNRSTVTGNTIELFANGQRQSSHSPSASSDNTVVTLSGTLAAATDYALVLTSGIQDLGGNALADTVIRFRTQGAPDFGQPQIVTMRPGSGATDVSPNTTVVLYATEAIEPGTLASGLFVSVDGVLIEGTTSVLGDGRTIEFDPDEPLPLGALVQVFARPELTDEEGNPLSAFQGSFTVAQPTSATFARLLSYTPALFTSAPVPTNVVFEARVNEPLDPATVTESSVLLYEESFAATVPGTVELTEGGRLVRFVPDAPLDPDATYYWQINGLQGLDDDFANVSLGGYLETGPGPDGTRPLVTAITPPDGATDVGVNASLTVRFDESINPLSVSGATIFVSGPRGTSVPCTISFGDQNRLVTIVPHDPLAPSALHTIRVEGVEDLAGNPVVVATRQFTTGPGPDTTAPTQLVSRPFNGASGVATNALIEVQFSEPLDPATPIVLSLSTTPAMTGTATLGADGRTVQIVPDGPWPVGTGVSWFLSGLRDLSGNPQGFGASGFFTASFAEDTTAPVVQATNPPDELTGVPTNVRPMLLFDEPVSLLGATVTLSAGGQPIVLQTPVLSEGNRRLAATPQLPLAPNTRHTLTITGVRDLTGVARTFSPRVVASSIRLRAQWVSGGARRRRGRLPSV